MKANGMQKKKLTGNGFLLLITIALFVVMYVAGMIVFADKGFAKPQMFLNLFVSNAGLLVIACGLTIVMITGGIDISVGSVTALVCMVLADLMENKGVNTYLAVLVALLIGVAFGIVQGFLVAYLDIQPFIVTLAGMFFGRGLTAIISTDMISIKNELFLKWANYRFYMPFGSTSKKGKFIPAYIPPTVVIALIVVIVIAVLLKYRKFGRKLYAIGGSRQSALMMGLNVKRTIFNAYVLDGFLAGLGGFLFCLNSCAGFVEQAKGLEMDAISSAVIGGTLLSGGVGTPIGTLFGVLIKFIQTFNQNVTGPSLVRLTCISAANCPLATVTFSVHFCEKYSYTSLANAGEAPFEKLGRKPFCVSAAKVNWDTTSTSPPICCTFKFILSFSSLKIR